LRCDARIDGMGRKLKNRGEYLVENDNQRNEFHHAPDPHGRSEFHLCNSPVKLSAPRRGNAEHPRRKAVALGHVVIDRRDRPSNT
jgi:hypothetical protein